MTTKGIHSEIVYSMSPSRNVCSVLRVLLIRARAQISDSLKRFGISPTSTSIMLLTHNDKSGKKIAAVEKKIKGTSVELTDVAKCRDVDKIKHVSFLFD